MLSRTALLTDHRLTDDALMRTYTRLFGLPLALAGDDTPAMQLVRHRAWQEARPFVTGEAMSGGPTSTPIPGMRATA